MDWASRAVLAWRLTNSIDSSFCISALDEALACGAKAQPERSPTMLWT
jgi:putative transposase